MEVYKTLVFFSDFDQSSPYLVDTVELGGRLWLVGSWRRDRATGAPIPKRIVLLSALAHQEVEGQPYRFALNNSMPKAVLDGETRAGYEAATYRARAHNPRSSGRNLH